ncbi:MAG: hypothetical protein IJU49_08275 [Lachnospiraceae bacterium]|nr:hypothetical protein [Lachnospiraceae bacterium]
MKITSFNPLIITPKADDIIAVFEALGFERRHNTVSDTEITGYSSVRMKNAEGFHVDITENTRVPQTMTAIRMNVDDFYEAYELLKSRGFINTLGDQIADNGSSHAAMMRSPSGFGISLIQHIKE